MTGYTHYIASPEDYVLSVWANMQGAHYDVCGFRSDKAHWHGDNGQCLKHGILNPPARREVVYRDWWLSMSGPQRRQFTRVLGAVVNGGSVEDTRYDKLWIDIVPLMLWADDDQWAEAFYEAFYEAP